MMVQWVVRWRQRTEEPILGRPLLSFVLIVVFGLYGVVAPLIACSKWLVTVSA